ncbi:MAG: site-specific DNA-methyltransferase [Candidatus Omnitrophota bacterium]
MITSHKILFQNSNDIKQISDNSVDLMITSPPYPMIQMWDEMFSEQNPEIRKALDDNDGSLAFELMNRELDKVWDEVYRVLKPGGIACINIGDATRSINNSFQLFSSSSRILNHCLKTGFSCLPKILWKKATNAPNKFMGSGMMPPGAYVTLEHEYILILRKGAKRDFSTVTDKTNRRESGYFWEERNVWFSDVWEGLNGAQQKLDDKNVRERSAAFPFELAYRLINMFSLKGDTVLDPYLGTGTTMLAAMTCGRNSIGCEIDPFFKNIIKKRIDSIVEVSNRVMERRINSHRQFVKEREAKKEPLKYLNNNYDFRVMTRQETEILFNSLKSVHTVAENEYEVNYHERVSKDTVVQKTISESYSQVSARETDNKKRLSVLTGFI